MLSIKEKVLQIAAKRRYVGVPKEDYLRVLRGISYGELERVICELERQGLITIDWIGPNQFVVFITSSGTDIVNSNLENKKVKVLA